MVEEISILELNSQKVYFGVTLLSQHRNFNSLGCKNGKWNLRWGIDEQEMKKWEMKK